MYEVSFPTKNDVPISDGGDLNNDENSPLICSDFRSISPKQGQQDFDDSGKKAKAIAMNWQKNSMILQFKCVVILKQNRAYNPEIGKRLN